MRQIEEALEKCDLFAAIGTSGTVYPAAGFVEIAKAHGAETHLFDVQLTKGSAYFDNCHLGAAGKTVFVWVSNKIGAVLTEYTAR